MADEVNCIPEVELRHLLDPLDYDNGPLQLLALRSGEPSGESTRETAPVAVSGARGTSPDAGYQVAV